MIKTKVIIIITALIISCTFLVCWFAKLLPTSLYEGPGNVLMLLSAFVAFGIVALGIPTLLIKKDKKQKEKTKQEKNTMKNKFEIK